jgi:hypothetical protein
VLFTKRSLVLALLLATGCSSAPKQEAPPPPPAQRTTITAGKKSTSDDIVVKKEDRSKTEASYLERSAPDHVSIDVKNADLKTVILPIFKNQVGVWIEYNEKLPKRIAGFQVRDLPWRDALGVLCFMTRMHLVPNEGSRFLEIKDAYEDPARTLASWQPDRPHRQGAPTVYGEGGGSSGSSGGMTYSGGGGSSGGGSSGGGSSGGGSSGGGDPDPTGAASSRGADQIDALRRGVSTTNSGGR